MIPSYKAIRSSVLVALVALLVTAPVHSQDGGQTGLQSQLAIGNQVPFSFIWGGTIQGDYVAAGVGMRNIGSGTINLTIPAGATVRNAFLFWSVIWDDTPPSNTGMFNGNAINGTLVGTSGSPCWGGDGINFYYANVYSYVNNGANTLANFPSGLTNNAPPIGNAVFPLMEGATLVVAFCHPAWDYNDVAVYVGAQTFATQATVNAFGSYTGWSGGNPADQTAQTTFIMADGQARFLGDGTRFNATLTSGPGTAVKTADAFDGADGIPVINATDGLWDTHTLDVSALFPNGVATAANVAAIAGTGGDCITWGGHVISVKSSLNAFLDVKAGSCPNPLDLRGGGILPVDLLGTSWFNVADVDPSTVLLEGVAPIGQATVQDSATPFLGGCSVMDCYDCNTLGADGFMDLHFRFNKSAIVAALGPVQDGDCIEVTLTGTLYNGTPFSATDVVRILDNSAPKSGADIAGFELSLAQNAPNPVLTGTVFSFTLPEASAVTLDVFNTLGQRVARVAEGVRAKGTHSVAWDGQGNGGARLAPGTYIYRLSAGDQTLSKTMVITR
jgi:hypothetical protein